MPGIYRWVCLAALSSVAWASTTTPPPDIANAIKLAEHALLLHNDRTSHFEKALNGFEKLLSNDEEPNLAPLIEMMEDLVHQTNVRQLEQLKDRLNEALDRELARRKGTKEPAAGKENSEPQVSAEYLNSTFDPVILLQKSEEDLEGWISELISQELENLATSTDVTSSGSAGAIVEDEYCVSTATAAQEVQEALVRFSQDGIGLQDHAQGGVVVYEMTSPTYTPQLTDEERLGGNWRWRRFIPEDVEDILPEGWMDWEVKIPSFLHHAFGSTGASTASQQTILHADTRPGSCWPMKGQSGLITFRLPYPVKVDAVTLDHASKLLLVSGSDQLASAPKQVKVYGYPPCDGDCEGLGFDSRDKFLLKEIIYDVDGPSAQTFYLQENVDTQEEQVPGSCSAASASCSAEPDNTVAAIQLVVETNWGNEAYTCLYRFRVHGEPAV